MECGAIVDVVRLFQLVAPRRRRGVREAGPCGTGDAGRRPGL